MKNQVRISFMLAALLFTASLLIYNTIVTKVVLFGPLAVPAGLIITAFTYIVNLIVTEVWGYRKSRLMIWSGTTMNLLAVAIYTMSINWEAIQFWQDQEFIETVMKSSPLLLLATLIAHPIGSFVSAWGMSRLRQAAHRKNFALRAIGSTALGAGIESLLFVLITSTGEVTFSKFILLIGIQLLVKLLFIILLLPLTRFVVDRLKTDEPAGEPDSQISYNPFNFKEL